MLYDLFEESKDIVKRDLLEAYNLARNGCVRYSLFHVWHKDLGGKAPAGVYSPEAVLMYWDTVQRELGYCATRQHH